MYLVFPTLEQAQAAQAQIDSNIVAVIAANEPEVVSDTGIIGRNAATGKLDYNATRTTTWCEPNECVEGWYLVKPVINHPYFVGVDVLVGVDGYEEYLDVMHIIPEPMMTEQSTELPPEEEVNNDIPTT